MLLPPAASGGSAPLPGTPAPAAQREEAGLHPGRPPAGRGPRSSRWPRSACLFCSRPVNCARRGGAGAPRGPAPSLPHVPALPAGGPGLSSS